MLLALALSACGGGGGGDSGTGTANRLASDVALPNKLSGGFAEGISADPDTGDLYVGTDNGSAAVTGFILKAGSQESSFSDWALSSKVGANGNRIAGTRVRKGVIYACVNGIDAEVWALKLSDRSVIAKMRLPGGRFCNDIAFDSAGQLFVTVNGFNDPDTIYKLAAANVPTDAGVQSFDWKTWHTSTDGLNGLTYSSALGKLLWSQGATIQSSATSADTASARTEITLPTGWSVDGLQLTSAGNLLLIATIADQNTASRLGVQLVNLGTGTKGLTSTVIGGTDCTTTVAIVGDDAFCTTDLQKVVRIAGAGKL